MRTWRSFNVFRLAIALFAIAASRDAAVAQRGNVHWGSVGFFQGDQDANALEGEAGRSWTEPLNWIQDTVPAEATNIEADHTIINSTNHERDPIINTDVGQMGRLLLVSGADLTIESDGVLETENIWIGYQTDFGNLGADISSTLTINGGSLISSADIQPGPGNEFHKGILQLNAGYVEARGIFMGWGALPNLSFMNIVDGTMDLQVLSFNEPGSPKVDISGTGTITIDNTFMPPWVPGETFDCLAEVQSAIAEGRITAFGGTGVVELDTTSIPGRFIVSAQLAGVDGDYNGDGNVDAADYTVWRNNLGGPGESLENRDPMNSGPVNSADYTYWKSKYGSGGAGAGGIAIVPELSSARLLLVLAFSYWCGPGQRLGKGRMKYFVGA